MKQCRNCHFKPPVNITKIEVWVATKQVVENTRNILAFLDLGETQSDMYNTTLFSDNADLSYPVMIIIPFINKC